MGVPSWGGAVERPLISQLGTMIILNSLSLNCLLSVFVLKQLVAEGGAQSPDVTDPCANAGKECTSWSGVYLMVRG